MWDELVANPTNSLFDTEEELRNPDTEIDEEGNEI